MGKTTRTSYSTAIPKGRKDPPDAAGVTNLCKTIQGGRKRKHLWSSLLTSSGRFWPYVELQGQTEGEGPEKSCNSWQVQDLSGHDWSWAAWVRNHSPSPLNDKYQIFFDLEEEKTSRMVGMWQQGAWTRWNGKLEQKLSWLEIRQAEAHWVKFRDQAMDPYCTGKGYTIRYPGSGGVMRGPLLLACMPGFDQPLQGQLSEGDVEKKMKHPVT